MIIIDMRCNHALRRPRVVTNFKCGLGMQTGDICQLYGIFHYSIRFSEVRLGKVFRGGLTNY